MKVGSRIGMHRHLPLSRALARVVLIAASLSLAAPALADETASEADLQFEIGKELFNKGDFRGALEHFLASNRLAPNRNVRYNIGACYEQLGRFPEAHSYLSQVLAAESDPSARQNLQEAIQRIAARVAVISVASQPAGAIIYINRKELGSRGDAPRSVALNPGKYKVIVELPGHEPTTVEVGEVAAGSNTPVQVKLVPITGAITVESSPAGASVRFGAPDGRVLGVSPLTAQLPVGRHSLFVSRDGHESAEVVVEVPPRGALTVRPKLAALRGSLVVEADMRDAPVEVDGKVLGFSPAVIPVTVGTHRVRVTMPGFRPFERTVAVKSNESTQVKVSIASREEVTGASRAAESVEEAPSSISIIGSRELEAMQYPTIAEALRGTRGLYLTDDRSYNFVGVRGFSRTSDYGNKILVLQDGQPLNDNLLGQSFAGFDGRVDLSDVERIEVIRGPGSVMYGTGAFFGVVNLITRNRETPNRVETSVSAVEDGVIRTRAMGNVRLGKEGALWTSVAVARGGGRDFYFPSYADENGGQARGVDGVRGGTLNGRFSYKALTVQWFFNSRKKQLPTAVSDTLFGDRRLYYLDTRGLVEARFEPKLSSAVQLASRAHANLYNFTAGLPYDAADGGLDRQEYRGRWVGVEQRVLLTPSENVRVIAGGEAQRHFSASMIGKDESETYMDVNNPYNVFSGYLNSDIGFARWIRASAGARFDHFSTFGNALSPRGAVILRPYENGLLKVMGGSAFRAPSVYEMYYSDAAQKASPNLGPERAVSGEIEFTHRFDPITSLTVGSYLNHVTGLTVGRGAGTEEDPFYLTNSDVPVRAFGGEVEARREWRDGWMLAANYTVQRAQYAGDAEGLREVPNSPTHLGSIRGGFPIIGRAFMATSRLSLESGRYDRYETTEDPAQSKTAGAAIWDLVFSGETEQRRIHYAFGVYNAGDYRYRLPISSEYRMPLMLQNGRTFLFSLGLRM